MKNIIRTALLTSCTLAALGTNAYSSDQAMQQAMPENSLAAFQSALELIQQEGFGDVHEIERGYGYIEVKVVGKNGDRIKLAISEDPQTITVMERKGAKYNNQYSYPTPAIKPSQILESLSQQGYSSIKEIELENGYYDVELRDKNGYKLNLVFDAHTGKILQQSDALRR